MRNDAAILENSLGPLGPFNSRKSERIRFPIQNSFSSNASTDFERSGTVVGERVTLEQA